MQRVVCSQSSFQYWFLNLNLFRVLTTFKCLSATLSWTVGTAYLFGRYASYYIADRALVSCYMVPDTSLLPKGLYRIGELREGVLGTDLHLWLGCLGVLSLVEHIYLKVDDLVSTMISVPYLYTDLRPYHTFG